MDYILITSINFLKEMYPSLIFSIPFSFFLSLSQSYVIKRHRFKLLRDNSFDFTLQFIYVYEMSLYIFRDI